MYTYIYISLYIYIYNIYVYIYVYVGKESGGSRTPPFTSPTPAGGTPARGVVMIWWTGLAPWGFDGVQVQRFRGGLVLEAHRLLYNSRVRTRVSENAHKSLAETPKPSKVDWMLTRKQGGSRIQKKVQDDTTKLAELHGHGTRQALAFRKSTLPQNRQLMDLIGHSEKQVDDFVGESTF